MKSTNQDTKNGNALLGLMGILFFLFGFIGMCLKSCQVDLPYQRS